MTNITQDGSLTTKRILGLFVSRGTLQLSNRYWLGQHFEKSRRICTLKLLQKQVRLVKKFG